MFESPWKLALGFFTGLLFGILLQKGRVAKYAVIMGQFLLRDFTVAKVMGTAVVVGAAGVYAMQAVGWVQLSVRPAAFAGVVGGAILFGIGMTVLGLCPGTTVAAVGEGRRDARMGVLGMLLGAGLYVAGFEALQAISKSLGDAGKVTLPGLTQTSPWLWIGALIFLGVGLLARDRQRNRKAAR